METAVRSEIEKDRQLEIPCPKIEFSKDECFTCPKQMGYFWVQADKIISVAPIETKNIPDCGDREVLVTFWTTGAIITTLSEEEMFRLKNHEQNESSFAASGTGYDIEKEKKRIQSGNGSK